MKSTTARYFESSLTMLPELEQSIFGWTMTVITASAFVLGMLGWGLSVRANAAEPAIASSAQQTPAPVEPVSSAAALGGVVVPDCYYPPNPAICFTGGGYGSDNLEGTEEAGIHPWPNAIQPHLPLRPLNPERANILEVVVPINH